MKTQIIHFGLAALLFLVSCSSSKTLPATIDKVTQKVQSKDYVITVNYANPLRGRQIYLTSDYDLKIKNDSAFAYLPYYGVAFVAPYGISDGGIKFSEPAKEYSIIPNKKNNGWDIRFKITTREYQYQFFVNIFNNGRSSFTVSSNQRDAISFTGELK
ncbi:MAG: DUF4251 domain-containing protein [Paludibacter sp.]|jgi:hypothetical protein|nr:DUF4251 domain-containing protein [Paludibacter sp.]